MMMAEAARVVDISTRQRGKSRGRAPQKARRISDLPRNQIACRVKHRWPTEEDLVYGRALPRGIKVAGRPDGTEAMEETCKRCGKTRALPMYGRTVDMHAPYSYSDPQDWVKMDDTLHATRRDLLGYLLRSVME
jgi:hypothetical protein